MSHELYFYVNAGDKPVRKGLLRPLKAASGEEYVSRDELRSFIHKYGHFKETATVADGFEGHYTNRHTGATVTFKLHTGTIQDMEIKYSFPGFNYTGLSVGIEYFRPAYFAREGAALIEALCRHFHMYVLDPQLSPLLKKCIAVNIIRSWETGNEKAVTQALAGAAGTEKGSGRVLEGRHARPYIPRDVLTDWWEYMSRKDELTRKVRESAATKVHVPEWRIIRRAGEKELYFAMTLAEGIGYVMPPCDVFLVKRNGFKEVGAVEAKELVPKIERYLKPWSFAGMDFKVLTSTNARKMAHILRETKLESIHKFEQIAPGSFIDVEVPASEKNSS